MSILREILSGATGQLSSKRVAGFTMIFSGTLTKILLNLDGILFTAAKEFDKIDASCNWLIVTGAGLLGLGLGELINKEKKND